MLLACRRSALQAIAHATAKAGIVGMTQTLAKEWGRMNVTVNCVAYGFIKTRLTVTASKPSGTLKPRGR